MAEPIRIVGHAGNEGLQAQVGNDKHLWVSDFFSDVATRNISNISTWSKIGFNAAVTTEQDIAPWLGSGSTPANIYSWPTGATTMTIVSSSIEDDPQKADLAAGTGAYTVTVYYLTTAYVEKSVTVTMNGQSAVQVATDIFRIQNVRIATAGTALAAVGNITIAAGGNTYGYISATKTRQRQLTWTVPAGKTLYVTNIAFSSSGQSAGKYVRFTTRATYDEKADALTQAGLFMPFNEIVTNNTSFNRELIPPTRLPEKTDLKVSAYADASAVVTSTLRGYLVTG
jgi:hypothetical protein